MKKFHLLVGVLGTVSACLLLNPLKASAADAPSAPEDAALVARSQVSQGNTARLQHVLAKARRGEPVTLSVIGGSITQGAKASTPDHRYGNLVAAWWQQKFPNSKTNFVNAGIGATGSNYASMRIQRDLLGQNPDLVIVEFAVNEGNTEEAAQTLEGVVRQILKQPNQPAVMLLFMVNRGGGSAQEWHSKVGTYYGLPMVSYRDAFWPEIDAKRLQWTDISPDEVHPNDRGHAAAAQFVETMIDSVLQTLPADDKLAPIPPLPQPILTNAFESTNLWEGTAMQPVSNTGWVYNEADKSWKSDVPGSVIEFEVEGRTLYTMHWVIKGPMGRAHVTIDGAPAAVPTLEGWFNQTWGGYRQLNKIATNLAPGKHRVRFELLPDKNADSTGTEFHILGLGAADIAGQ